MASESAIINAAGTTQAADGRLAERRESFVPRHGYGRLCRGGPGNKSAGKVERLRQALLACVQPEDMKRMVKKTMRQAEGGDMDAMRLLWHYLLGKPESMHKQAPPSFQFVFNVSGDMGLNPPQNLASQRVSTPNLLASAPESTDSGAEPPAAAPSE